MVFILSKECGYSRVCPSDAEVDLVGVLAHRHYSLCRNALVHVLHLRVDSSVTTIESINGLNRLLSLRLIKSILVYKIDCMLGFQMTHIEVKSIEKWLRDQLKYN